MGCTAKNKRTGQVYYLHKKGHLHYFSKTEKGNVEKPKNMRVVYADNGFPLLKRM